MKPFLTLRDALAQGQLPEFIAQREAEGIGPVDADELNEALAGVITSPAGSRPASRSPEHGGSRGK